MDKNIIVECNGFMGDNLFALSLCEQLNKQKDYKVWLKLRVASNGQFIALSDYIEGVILKDGYIKKQPPNDCELIVINTQLNYITTPIIQIQNENNIDNPINDFSLNYKINKLNNKETIIGYGSDWELRSFLFTEQEYKNGIDIPNFGYGGKHRNIKIILRELENHNIKLIPIGNGLNYNYNTPIDEQFNSFKILIDNLTKCDYFIGAEGGLANLSYALRIPTILTSDFVHQLYGWNGVMKKVDEPKLGPIYYKHNSIHTNLDPYLTDLQVSEQIIKTVKNEYK